MHFKIPRSVLTIIHGIGKSSYLPFSSNKQESCVISLTKKGINTKERLDNLPLRDTTQIISHSETLPKHAQCFRGADHPGGQDELRV
jgi:hypothetical protein